MTGLILKDFFCMRKTLRSILFVLIIWGFVFLPAGQVDFLIYMLGMFWVIMLVNAAAFDQQSKWDGYAIAMPLSRREIVKARYIFGMLFCVLGAVFTLLIGVIGVLFFDISLSQMLTGILVSISVGIFYISLSMPFIYRYGAEKSRIVMGAFFVLIYGGALLAHQFFDVDSLVSFFAILDMRTLVPLAVALIAGCYGLSYRISQAIYRKKEF